MRKTLWWLTGIAAAFALIIAMAVMFIDEPLRAYVEQEVNKRVQGYTLRIGVLDFHPIGFSLDLEDVTVVQNEYPDPPVAHIAKWTASVHWRDVLTGNLDSDHTVDRPTLHLTRSQLKKELEDDVAVKERGWQDAVKAIYPLKLNVFTITDGDVTYADNPRAKPVRLRHLNCRAENIRNIESEENVYPSKVHLDSTVFENGRLIVDGSADFLSEPHMGIDADVELERADLDDLVSLAGRMQVQIRDGLLTAKGHVQYAPHTKVIRINAIRMENVKLDYVHTGKANPTGEQAVKQTAQAAEKATKQSKLLLKIEEGHIENSEFGFVNKGSSPNYRVFMNGTDVYLQNVSNRLSEETAVIRLRGMFMGNGATIANGVFRPETKAPDFDLNIRVIKAQAKSINDLLRAYGDFDVTAGLFSVYTELKTRNGRVDGYVKPLFKNLEVYDPEQDKHKGLLSKIYEGVIGDVAEFLTNTPRDEVATKADVSGSVKNPRASTWEVIIKLIQNAFFEAILPGFEGGRTTA